MDHHGIEESHPVAAYVAGTLPPDEEARFEEHLLECGDCRRAVESEEEMRLGFQAFREEEAEAAAAPLPLSPAAPQPFPALAAPRGPAHRGRRRRLPQALAAAALLALAAPLVWLVAERAELRRELARLRAPSRPAPAPPGVGRTAPQTGGTERAETARLEAELLRAREKGERLALELAETLRARGNAPVYTLGFVRGAGAEANRVELGARPEWIVLVVELPDSASRSYEATLVGADGKARWRVANLLPRGDDTVSIGLWSGDLSPGAYRLRLAGSGGESGAAAPFELPLQVVASPAAP